MILSKIYLYFITLFCLMGLPVYGKSYYQNQYEILTKKEVLIKLVDMCEESELRMKRLEENGLDETIEYYQELGFYQGIKEAIYIVKFMKKP